MQRRAFACECKDLRAHWANNARTDFFPVRALSLSLTYLFSLAYSFFPANSWQYTTFIYAAFRLLVNPEYGVAKSNSTVTNNHPPHKKWRERKNMYNIVAIFVVVVAVHFGQFDWSKKWPFPSACTTPHHEKQKQTERSTNTRAHTHTPFYIIFIICRPLFISAQPKHH